MPEELFNNMNILRKTRCYLVGAMEYEDGRGWRNKIKNALYARNITCYDPYHKPFINEIREDENARCLLKSQMESEDYDTVALRMKEVRRDDLRLCDVSDFFIVHITPNIPSWGSAEEIFWANRLKKPIFLIVEGGKKYTPLWIMGTIPHKYIYSSVEQVLEVVEGIDDGKIEIDSKRWRLLKPELR